MNFKNDCRSAALHLAALPFWLKIIISVLCLFPIIATWLLMQMLAIEAHSMASFANILATVWESESGRLALADYSNILREFNDPFKTLIFLSIGLSYTAPAIFVPMWGYKQKIPRKGGVVLAGLGILLAFLIPPNSFLRSLLSSDPYIILFLPLLLHFSYLAALATALIFAGVKITLGKQEPGEPPSISETVSNPSTLSQEAENGHP